MKKILIFSGSNSSQSINTKLAGYIQSQVAAEKISGIDLRDYPLPIYAHDIENGEGVPENAQKLKAVFDAHDAFIITLPEHNTSLSAFFKNTIDWLSRVEMGFFADKPILLFGTSPGPGGARNVLAHAEKVLSGYLRGKVIGALGLPKFHKSIEKNEDNSIAVTDEAFNDGMKTLLEKLQAAMTEG